MGSYAIMFSLQNDNCDWSCEGGGAGGVGGRDAGTGKRGDSGDSDNAYFVFDQENLSVLALSSNDGRTDGLKDPLAEMRGHF